jgi:eukaryotic-like serine/threonine-protein kinase
MFQIGQSLGDYAIRQELGKGGFGRVYQVEHTLTGRREAMKILAASHSPEQAERFLREIRLQASLTHPNIAVVHTAFWVNDDLALVCEYLEGQPLQRLLEQQPPPVKRALDMIGQVLQGLSYAHARGIIHRDITPANIFLTSSGPVKIIDFGLAKAATDLRLTQEGSPIGAAHYMSPEQIRGAQEIDARTDIYSCGVVLYELVTGKKPFEGDDSFTIMKGHAEELPSSPTAVNSTVSKELSGIILRALSKKPEDRFQSADAFLQAITLLQSRVQPTQTRSVQHAALMTAAAVSVAAIGFLGVSSYTARFHAAQADAERRVSFTVPPPPPVTSPNLSPPLTSPSESTGTKSPRKNIRPLARKKEPIAMADASVSARPTVVVGDRREAAKEPPISEPPVSSSINVVPSVASEAKPHSSVVKAGAALKKLNPFHSKREALQADSAAK